MKGATVCIVCQKSIGKSGYKVQCAGKCSGWAHLACTGNRKDDILQKKKFKWICPDCDGRASSSDESSEEESTLQEACKRSKKKGSQENVLTTDEMLKKLLGKFESLETAVTFNGNIMEEMKDTLEEIKRENKSLRKEQEKLKVEIQHLKNEVDILKNQAAASATAADVQARGKNVVVVGIAEKSDIVKVLNNLEVNLKEEDIKTKVIPSGNLMKPIIVTFQTESVRNEVLIKRKSRGLLNSENMGLDGEKRNIFINEDLPKAIRDLFKKAKELKNVGYKYIWIKEGKVLCRRSENSKIVQVFSDRQVDSLKEM